MEVETPFIQEYKLKLKRRKFKKCQWNSGTFIGWYIMEILWYG